MKIFLWKNYELFNGKHEKERCYVFINCVSNTLKKKPVISLPRNKNNSPNPRFQITSISSGNVAEALTMKMVGAEYTAVSKSDSVVLKFSGRFTIYRRNNLQTRNINLPKYQSLEDTKP